MALKSKLILLITMAALALCVIIAGVYAAAQQKISMQGTINISVDDQTLYLRDVRVQTNMNQAPTSVEGFRKGYINGDFGLDLSSHGLPSSSTGTFVMYFDVVNLIVGGQTSEYLAEASWTGSEVAGASFSIDHDSRMIDEGTVAPTAFTDSTPLSGTIVLEVNVLSGTSFDLSNITITIREPQQIANLTFYTDDAAMTASVVSCATTATSAIIPQTISHSGGTFWEGNDYTVIRIEANAFSSRTNLTTINIPDSVTSIGDNAFSGCTNLTTINIPDGVTGIGYSVFSGCTNLTTINIPDGVTVIGYSAFQSCTNLTTINIPDSVTSIAYRAFQSCTNLTTINIPNSVTSIADNAFKDCSSLTSITVEATTPPSLGTEAIPSNVKNIYVPTESVGAYKAASGWSEFESIISAIA